ncbi:hypothetical protein A2U01_0118156, partial [Trifolium medium]|nr:hypothetical protein [Trifolium medium]
MSEARKSLSATYNQKNRLIDDLAKVEANVALAASKKVVMMEAWANMRS